MNNHNLRFFLGKKQHTQVIRH